MRPAVPRVLFFGHCIGIRPVPIIAPSNREVIGTVSDQGRYLLWPKANDVTLVWAVVLFVGLLVCAFLIEIYRRRRERTRRLRAAWEAARKVADQKELSQREWALLDKVLHRHAAHSPFKAVTLRNEFDRCVEREIAGLPQEDPAVLDRYGTLLRDIRIRLGLDYIPFGQRIHTTRELYTQQVLWASLAGVDSPEWHRMRVTAVDEAHFRLAVGSDRPRPPFQAGGSLRFRMWREEDARYTFSARIERVEEDPPTWVMRHAWELKRTQSRAHFRIRHEQAANVGILNAPVNGDTSAIDRRKTVTRLRGRFTSLSGGGFAVLLFQPVPKQVLLRTTLELDPETTPIEVTARLVATAPLSSGQYLVRAAFIEMSDTEREAITRHIFRRQQQHGLAEAAGME